MKEAGPGRLAIADPDTYSDFEDALRAAERCRDADPEAVHHLIRYNIVSGGGTPAGYTGEPG
jgi:hypothetical protein